MELLNKPIKDFCKMDIVLVVESSLLQEKISFVPNERILKKREKEVVGVAYLGEELVRMLSMTPEQIKHTHMVKKVLGGKLLQAGNEKSSKVSAAPPAAKATPASPQQVKRFASSSYKEGN